MTDSIGISVSLRCSVRNDDGRWVAGCPALDVFSQGADREDAKRCLREAVLLWVESCVERGTLDEALRESGFRRVSSGEPALPEPASGRSRELLGRGNCWVEDVCCKRAVGLTADQVYRYALHKLKKKHVG